ncbi:MAG: hypothetical protein WAM95_03005 [Bacillus sp. (in: firmicutes)]
MDSKVRCSQLENEYFVGWGTLALINAGLAQGKNRTGITRTDCYLTFIVCPKEIREFMKQSKGV